MNGRDRIGPGMDSPAILEILRITGVISIKLRQSWEFTPNPATWQADGVPIHPGPRPRLGFLTGHGNGAIDLRALIKTPMNGPVGLLQNRISILFLC